MCIRDRASAAAAKVIGLLCKDSLTCNPCVAQPDEMMCNGCSNCEKVCPYGATADGLVLGYRAGAKLLYPDTLQYLSLIHI